MCCACQVTRSVHIATLGSGDRENPAKAHWPCLLGINQQRQTRHKPSLNYVTRHGSSLTVLSQSPNGDVAAKSSGDHWQESAHLLNAVALRLPPEDGEVLHCFWLASLCGRTALAVAVTVLIAVGRPIYSANPQASQPTRRRHACFASMRRVAVHVARS
jgi:hypothetical protein